MGKKDKERIKKIKEKMRKFNGIDWRSVFVKITDVEWLLEERERLKNELYQAKNSMLFISRINLGPTNAMEKTEDETIQERLIGIENTIQSNIGQTWDDIRWLIREFRKLKGQKDETTQES